MDSWVFSKWCLPQCVTGATHVARVLAPFRRRNCQQQSRGRQGCCRIVSHLSCARGIVLAGGWDETQYYRDVWAFDVTQLARPSGQWTNTTWVNVIPNDAQPTDTPSARNGQSLSVYEDRMYMVRGSCERRREGGGGGRGCPEG